MNLESTHNLVLQKIEVLSEAIDLLLNFASAYKVSMSSSIVDLKTCHDDIHRLEREYHAKVSGLVAAYYNRTDDVKLTTREYTSTVKSINVINKFDSIIIILSSICNNDDRYDKIPRRIHDLLEKAEKYMITIETERTDAYSCDCGGIKLIIPETSTSRCPKCGVTEILVGTLFEDSHFYAQDGYLVKQKIYNPNIHCAKWVRQIQAEEGYIVPPEDLKKIEECVKRDYTVVRYYKGVQRVRLRSLSGITCSEIRGWLKKCKITHNNDHIPLIRTIITGVPPPKMDYDTEQTVLMLASRAIDIFDEVIKGKLRHNNLHYPYVIYKILTQLSKKQPELKKHLPFIHLQARNTVLRNDEMWRIICNHAPEEFTYEPTSLEHERS